METKRRVDAETSVATYAYLGDNGRAKKVVSNCGTEHLAGDEGNTTVHYYYCGTGFQPVNWNICETRNGSNQATAQYVWGTQYTDEIVFVDVNDEPGVSDDCSPDNTSGGKSAGSDDRYFYHQDRNWNVVAISEYDTGGTNNGRIVERYSYTPYGQFVVLEGDSGSGELGNVSPTSTVGNPLGHQGLPIDHEKGSHQNRFREYALELQRFVQRDPLAQRTAKDAGYQDGQSLYGYVRANPVDGADPSGLASWWHQSIPGCPWYKPKPCRGACCYLHEQCCSAPNATKCCNGACCAVGCCGPFDGSCCTSSTEGVARCCGLFTKCCRCGNLAQHNDCIGLLKNCRQHCEDTYGLDETPGTVPF